MNARILAGVFAALIVTATPVLGDLEKGTYAPEIEAKEWLNTPNGEAVSLTERRGLVVVLFFWTELGGGGEQLLQYMNVIDIPIIGRQQGVCVIGLTESSADKVQDSLKKYKVAFPIGVESETFKEYRLDNMPSIVIILPNGKIHFSGLPTSENSFFEELSKIEDKDAPFRTHPEEAAGARDQLDDARKLVREDQYHQAFADAREAYERCVTGDPLKATCQDMMELVELLGQERFEQAEEEARQKKFTDAVDSLRFIRRNFTGTEVARAAREMLDDLKEKYDAVAALLKDQKRETDAWQIVKSGADLLKSGRYDDAYEAFLKARNDYDKTEAAGEAKTLITRMRAVPALQPILRNHDAAAECEPWLSQARSYMTMRRFGDASKLLRQVVEKYPDTRYAEEARTLLVELPR